MFPHVSPLTKRFLNKIAARVQDVPIHLRGEEDGDRKSSSELGHSNKIATSGSWPGILGVYEA
eukprot:4247019-Pleurochrysis_carterae.AAC.2